MDQTHYFSCHTRYGSVARLKGPSCLVKGRNNARWLVDDVKRRQPPGAALYTLLKTNAVECNRVSNVVDLVRAKVLACRPIVFGDTSQIWG